MARGWTMGGRTGRRDPGPLVRGDRRRAPRARRDADDPLRAAGRKRRRGGPVDRARHADPHRGDAAAPTRTSPTTGCSSSSARAPTGARRCARCCGRARRSSCRRSRGRPTSTCSSPCTYDLDVTATRYFDALHDGDVPLEFLFSGTVFYSAADGRLQTARLSWELEAEYRLPVAVWRETLDHHFPGTAWLRLDRESHRPARRLQVAPRAADVGAVLDELLPAKEDGA